MNSIHFEHSELPPEARALQSEVREFLRAELPADTARRYGYSWGGYDRAFTRKVGARGWIGMTWPKRYGGHERSALERWVVQEEMLAGGAPAMCHWIADRQYGPMFLRFGTDAQREHFLPRMASGEYMFCIGMSEPDAGSDLAAVRTKATRVDGGYELHGTKVWTSGAHLADFMVALVRTGGPQAQKHAGLSQFLVDLKAPGVKVSPIIDLLGNHHFNEVHFDACFVPEDRMIGTEGEGWKQVTSELAFERSGPDRYLASISLLFELIRQAGKEPDARTAAAIGKLVAQLSTLRQMSLSVAAMLQAGRDPAIEAAVVKDVGTQHEQSVPEVVHEVLGVEPRVRSGADLERAQAWIVAHAPSFTIRGGAREVIRGIIARGLGLR